MQFYESFWLGLTQGITEILPLSSNGHMRISLWLLGHVGDPSDYWDCISQLFGIGVFLALIAYYYADIALIAKKNKRLLLDILIAGVISFVGAFLIGILMKDFFTNEAGMTLIMIVFALTGIALVNGCKFFKDGAKAKLEALNRKQVLNMGVLGMLGGIPGISFTFPLLLSARMNGLNARRSTKIAHLIMIPVLLGINIVSYVSVLSYPDSLIHSSDTFKIVIANVISFAFAYITLWWLNRYLEKRNNYRVFGYCRIILAAIMLIFILLK